MQELKKRDFLIGYKKNRDVQNRDDSVLHSTQDGGKGEPGQCWDVFWKQN